MVLWLWEKSEVNALGTEEEDEEDEETDEEETEEEGG
jgi:hypothetical protein